MFLFSHQGNAQKFGVLSEHDKELFSKKTEEKIKALSNFFEKIAHLPKSSIREELIKICLTGFTPDATMQIGNIKNGELIKSKPIPIGDYLRYSLKPSKYKIVDVSIIDFKVEDFKPSKYDPEIYEANFTYTQRFCASIGGLRNPEGNIKYDYCDDTKKSGKIILKKKHTVLGTKWVLFMDSITVIDVKILK